MERAEAELERLRQQIAEKERELEELKPKYEEMKSREEECTSALALNQQKRQELYAKQGRGTQFTSKQDRDRCIEKELKSLNKQIKDKKDHENKLREDLRRDASKLTELEKKIEDLTKEMERQRVAIDEHNKQYHECKKRKDQEQSTRNELWRKETTLTQNLSSLKEDLAKADQALRSMAGKPILNGRDSVRKVLETFQERGGEWAKIATQYYGPVIENFTCDKTIYTAVEVTAGNRLFHHIVESDTVGTKILKEMDRQSLPGEVTFMPLDRLQVRDMVYPNDNNAIAMVQKLKYDPKYAKAMKYIFGKTLICRNLECATELGKQFHLDCVTLEGDQVSSKGSLTGGYFNQSRSRLEMQKTRSELMEQITTLDQELSTLRQGLSKTESSINSIVSEMQRTETKQGKAKDIFDKVKADIRLMNEELSSIERFRGPKERSLAQCRFSLEAMQATREGLESELHQTTNLKSLASSNYGSDVDIINEDGELATAYEAQKGIKRQLQEELVAEKKFCSEHISKAKVEIDKLREENEKYQKLLSADLSQEPRTKEQEFANNEIIQLAAENLALQERVDELSESCRCYKNVSVILESSDTVAPHAASLVEIAPVTRKKEREYLGMFEYKIQDEGAIIKKLILELNPRVAVTLLPGLPAYIIFMMLRHTDYVDDEPKMHLLMKAVRSGVKRTLKNRADSQEYNVLWLANMLRLLNNLRQYSGDAVYQTHNTPRQNQQCLRIFDLSQYQQVLSDTAVSIYQGLTLLLERQLERLIVPAILENEEISWRSGPRSPPAPSPAAPPPTPGPARLKAQLMEIHTHLHTNHVDEALRVMIFKQLFYYICAYSLNQLLLRKDLCCWAKGLQIRYNISHLETWIKENLAEYGQKNTETVLAVLRPITQAVQLLQARKSMADVQSTVEMCPDLSAMQVCKILNMYTPAEEYEVKVTREFVHEIQKQMQARALATPTAREHEPQNLLMDSKKIFSVQFPFYASPIRLEDIELPEVLGLNGLLTKI